MTKNSKKAYEMPAIELIDLMSYEAMATTEEDDIPQAYSNKSSTWGPWV